MNKQKNIFFNANHSPMGAFASFTLGFPGAKGGLDLELGKPADQNIYIGLETSEKNVFEAFPFFEGFEDERARFDLGIGGVQREKTLFKAFEKDDIQRAFEIASDTWRCGDLTFTIYSPAESIPDPDHADSDALKYALTPAVIAELTVDNTQQSQSRKAFFGFQGVDPYCGMRRLDETTAGRLKGVAQGRHIGIATTDPQVYSGLGFNIEEILTPTKHENLSFALGHVGALVADVPAGAKKTMRFAVCFYRGGIVTSGLDTSYYYTRFFDSIEDVATYAIDTAQQRIQTAVATNEHFRKAALSDDQYFMLAHSVHSYYTSTELLDHQGGPFWVINEGEYRMMNTLDLTVDQLFFEMYMNPWTVRNTLEKFVDRYSYQDQVRFPDDSTCHPGGISFTHDMGIANVFSREKHSCYEQFGMKGCFSHMTQEELVNWLSCGTIYCFRTQNKKWLSRYLHVFEAGLQSMLNRDHPDPDKRNGVMSLDSSRTMGGSEITTYDSLDASLGQARDSVYLAVKCMSVYLGLEQLFKSVQKQQLADTAYSQAVLCAQTLLKSVQEDCFPAVFNQQKDMKVISVIEGLVYCWFNGSFDCLKASPFTELLEAMKVHLGKVLVPGVCLFEDGGWKLSSSNDNSWLSKIYIAQFVYRTILGLTWDETCQKADQTHLQWLTHPETSYWCWSDQVVKGIIEASKYYPRGVSSMLWVYESQAQDINN